MIKETSDLQAKLKKADPIIRDYVTELETRNAKRQHQIVKLEADKVERDNRIKALENEIKNKTQVKPQVNISIKRYEDDLSQLSEQELQTRLFALAEKTGYRLTKISSS